MLLEFDADQRLWQETVRDAVAKQCPPSLVRRRRRGRRRPGAAVEDLRRRGLDRADRPGECRRAGDRARRARPGDRPDAVPGDDDASSRRWSATASTRSESGTAVYGGVTAHRDADGWVLDGTARHVLDGDRADRFAVVTEAGGLRRRRRRPAARRRSRSSIRCCTSPRCRSRACDWPTPTRVRVDAERARHVALTGMAITMVGACQRILDLVLEHVKQRQQFGVPIGSFQAIQHKAVDMHVAIERARALSYFAALTIAGGRSAPAAGGGDGQGGGGGVPGGGVPARPAAVRRHGLHVGERSAVRAEAGQGRRAACSAARPSTARLIAEEYRAADF